MCECLADAVDARPEAVMPEQARSCGGWAPPAQLPSAPPAAGPLPLAALLQRVERVGPVAAVLTAGDDFHVYRDGLYSRQGGRTSSFGRPRREAHVPVLVVGSSMWNEGGRDSSAALIVDPGLGTAWGRRGLALVDPRAVDVFE